MNKKTKKTKLVITRNWFLISLIITIITAISFSLAIYLDSLWSFVPIIALITFVIIFISLNPAGRYFRFAVSVFSLWSTATLTSAYSLNFSLLWDYKNNALGGLFIDKQGGLDWYIHLFFFVFIILLIAFDYNSRESIKKTNTNKLNDSEPTKKVKVTYTNNATHNGDNNF